MVILRRESSLARKSPDEKLREKMKLVAMDNVLPSTPKIKLLNIKSSGFEDEYVINYFSKSH